VVINSISDFIVHGGNFFNEDSDDFIQNFVFIISSLVGNGVGFSLFVAFFNGSVNGGNGVEIDFPAFIFVSGGGNNFDL